MNIPIQFLNKQLSDANAVVREKIIHLLRKQNFSAFSDLEVIARDGVVILKGFTRSFYDKQIALNHGRCIAGPSNVIDEIVVQKVDRCNLSNRFRLAD